MAALVRAAHDLFLDKGYAATRTEEIVQRAAVTRGALYHHFADKRELFQEVFVAVQEQWVARYFHQTAANDDPWDRLREGVQMFLDSAVEADVRKIILIEGPAVLGWDAWHELAGRYTGILFETAIDAAIENGTISPLPAGPLAHLLMASFQTAGILVAKAPDPAHTRREMSAVVDRLLDGLRSRVDDAR